MEKFQILYGFTFHSLFLRVMLLSFESFALWITYDSLNHRSGNWILVYSSIKDWFVRHEPGRRKNSFFGLIKRPLRKSDWKALRKTDDPWLGIIVSW